MKKIFNAKTVFKFIFSIFFVFVVMYVFVTAYKPYVETEILHREQVTQSAPAVTKTGSKRFNSKREYPFKNTNTQQNAAKSASAPAAKSKSAEPAKKTVLDRVRNKIARLKKKLDSKSKTIYEKEDEYEAYLGEDYEHYMDALFTKKRFEKLMGFNCTTSSSGMKNSMRTSGDVVVELDKGVYAFVVDNVDVKGKANKIVKLAKSIEDRGIDFLMFETPAKAYGDNVNRHYFGAYKDYSKEKMDEVFDVFDKNNVQYFSMTRYLAENYEDRQPLFFKTDHHWLPQTAIMADGLLANELNKRFGYSIDTSLFDIENYDVKMTEPIYLGSLGRKITEVYAEKEAMPIVTPKYDTRLEVFQSKTNMTYEGSIEDTLMNYDELDLSIRGLYNSEPYRFYCCGNMEVMRIHNLEKKDGKKILLIKNSYTNAMAPYFSTAAEYVDLVDLRYFKGSVQTYIDKTEPDTVVLTYGPTAFENGGMIGGFNENTFNFD